MLEASCTIFNAVLLHTTFANLRSVHFVIAGVYESLAAAEGMISFLFLATRGWFLLRRTRCMFYISKQRKLCAMFLLFCIVLIYL